MGLGEGLVLTRQHHGQALPTPMAEGRPIGPTCFASRPNLEAFATLESELHLTSTRDYNKYFQR